MTYKEFKNLKKEIERDTKKVFKEGSNACYDKKEQSAFFSFDADPYINIYLDLDPFLGYCVGLSVQDITLCEGIRIPVCNIDVDDEDDANGEGMRRCVDIFKYMISNCYAERDEVWVSRGSLAQAVTDVRCATDFTFAPQEITTDKRGHVHLVKMINAGRQRVELVLRFDGADVNILDEASSRIEIYQINANNVTSAVNVFMQIVDYNS